MVNKGFFADETEKAETEKPKQKRQNGKAKSESLATGFPAAQNDQAVTPAPIGHDTPVPPSPQ